MKVKNNSGWHPVGQAILLRATELEKTQEKAAGGTGMIVVPDEVRKSSAAADIVGIVVEMGADCYAGTVGDSPNAPSQTPRCEVGDIVAFTKYTGAVIIGNDGYTYRMINAGAVYAVRDEE